MPLLLLIFFGLYGWIEFEAFIIVGNAVGGLVTFLGIFVTAFIGVTLMKRQGKSVIRHWKTNLNRGEINTSTLASGISLILGAVLMLLPGYVTDFTGLLCFTPGLRVLIGQGVLSRLGSSIFSSSLASGLSGRFGAAGDFSCYNKIDTEHDKASSYPHNHSLEGDVIEGQFESKDDAQK